MILPPIIPPSQVARFCKGNGIPAGFSDDELERLAATRPEPRQGFVSFPVPAANRHLSLLGLRAHLGTQPEDSPFVFFDHPWYLDEAFGSDPPLKGWHTIAAAPLEASLDQPVYFADGLVAGGLLLPRASEVALMLFLNLFANGDRLLLRKHTWTRDRTLQRRFVSVGAFGRKGLFVSSHEVGYKSRGLGICPERARTGY